MMNHQTVSAVSVVDVASVGRRAVWSLARRSGTAAAVGVCRFCCARTWIWTFKASVSRPATIALCHNSTSSLPDNSLVSLIETLLAKSRLLGWKAGAPKRVKWSWATWKLPCRRTRFVSTASRPMRSAAAARFRSPCLSGECADSSRSAGGKSRKVHPQIAQIPQIRMHRSGK